MFQKGHRPIGAGRPATGETWRDLIIATLDEKLPNGVTKRKAIIDKATGLALRGVPWAIQFLTERCEGRPGQAILIAGAGANPLAGLSEEALARVVALAEQGFLANPKPDGSSKQQLGQGSTKKEPGTDEGGTRGV